VLLPLIFPNGVLPGITSEDINATFAFNEISRPHMSDACKESYIAMLVALADLPAGREVLGHIIRKSAINRSGRRGPNAVHRVIFLDNGGVSAIYPNYGPGTCAINIQRAHGGHGDHVGCREVLLVKDAPNGSVDFVAMECPPVVSLAHELGHFLYAIETNAPRDGNVNGAMRGRAQAEYGQIFQEHISSKSRPSDRFFSDIWNHSKQLETLNILPASQLFAEEDGDIPRFLPALSPEEFNPRAIFGENLVIGDIVLGQNSPIRFFDLKTGKLISIDSRGVSRECFFRVGHWTTKAFSRGYWKLSQDEQNHFRNDIIPNNLLSHIALTTGGTPKVDDLPLRCEYPICSFV
jgi:hypothetical protein